MAILYQDQYLLCDSDALIIENYYFPVGSKRIPYDKIRQVTLETLDFWNGGGRLWGMGLSPHWFHLDLHRWQKKHCLIVEEVDNWVQSVITPDDPEQVLTLLQNQNR